MSGSEATPTGAGTNPVISETLLKLLVCPLDQGTLELVGSTLVCSKCQRVYPVKDGIPNMLAEPGP